MRWHERPTLGATNSPRTFWAEASTCDLLCCIGSGFVSGLDRIAIYLKLYGVFHCCTPTPMAPLACCVLCSVCAECVLCVMCDVLYCAVWQVPLLFPLAKGIRKLGKRQIVLVPLGTNTATRGGPKNTKPKKKKRNEMNKMKTNNKAEPQQQSQRVAWVNMAEQEEREPWAQGHWRHWRLWRHSGTVRWRWSSSSWLDWKWGPVGGDEWRCQTKQMPLGAAEAAAEGKTTETRKLGENCK